MNKFSSAGQMIFFREWLQVEKRDFRILAMLADKGIFSGNLSSLCDYFSLSRQSSHIRNLRESIQKLKEEGFIECEVRGRTYTLKIVPKGEKIEIPRRWVIPIIEHRYHSQSVSWESVLKVFIWIFENRIAIITNADIAKELHLSIDVIVSAKNVLKNDMGAILHEIEKVVLADGSKRNIGQRLSAIAEWSE